MVKRLVNWKDPDTGRMKEEGAVPVGSDVERYDAQVAFLKERLKGTKYENFIISEWLPYVSTSLDRESKPVSIKDVPPEQLLAELGVKQEVT